MLYPVFLLVYFLASCLALFYYRQQFVFLKKRQGYLLWFSATFIFWLSRPIAPYLPFPVLKALALFGGFWSFFLYYSLLLGTLHYLILVFVKRLTNRADNIGIYATKIRKVGLFIIFICMVIGTIEAYNPIMRYEIIKTDKIARPVRVVLVSDLHLGTFLGQDYCENLVSRINDEKPDIVFIAGDIIDDRYEIVKRQDSMKPLAKIEAKLGVAAVLGNHDYFDRRTDEEIDYLKKIGVAVLVNEDKLLDQIYVVGLKDFSKDQQTEYLESLSKSNKNNYSILLEHQPRRIDAASKTGYDLYLAGHTHGGAFFPNGVFTKLIHQLDYGRQDFGDMTAIVTSGYGFFGIPVRLGVRSEYVVIDLQPASY